MSESQWQKSGESKDKCDSHVFEDAVPCHRISPSEHSISIFPTPQRATIFFHTSTIPYWSSSFRFANGPCPKKKLRPWLPPTMGFLVNKRSFPMGKPPVIIHFRERLIFKDFFKIINQPSWLIPHIYMEPPLKITKNCDDLSNSNCWKPTDLPSFAAEKLAGLAESMR